MHGVFAESARSLNGVCTESCGKKKEGRLKAKRGGAEKIAEQRRQLLSSPEALNWSACGNDLISSY